MSAAPDFASIDAFGGLVADQVISFGEALDELIVAELGRVDPDVDPDHAAIEDAATTDLAEAASRAAGLPSTDQQPPAARGLPVRYPAPTEPPAAALARQDRAIGATIRQAVRVAAARRQVQLRRAAAIAELPDPTPVAKAHATRRIIAEVAAESGFGRRIPPAPRLLLTGSQGTGKTRTALRVLAGIRSDEALSIWVAEPTLDKAVEVAADYRRIAGADSLPVQVVRGRGAPDPTKERGSMCARAPVAEKVARAGLSVRDALCQACPLRGACGYLRQEREIAALDGRAVFVLAHSYLFLPAPAPAPDLLVADEDVAMKAIDVAAVPLAALAGEVVPYRGHDLAAVIAPRETLAQLRTALARPDALTALREAGITRTALRAAIRLIEPEATPAVVVDGAMPDAEIEATIDALAEPAARQALVVLRAVARELDQPRPMLNGVTYDPIKQELTVSRLRRPHGIRAAAMLGLDGTGNPELWRAVFGASLQHVAVRIERDAKVIGTRLKSYSRQSITGADRHGRLLPRRADDAARLQSEIAAVVARQPGPVFVATTMQAEDALVLPSHVLTGHFGVTS